MFISQSFQPNGAHLVHFVHLVHLVHAVIAGLACWNRPQTCTHRMLEAFVIWIQSISHWCTSMAALACSPSKLFEQDQLCKLGQSPSLIWDCGDARHLLQSQAAIFPSGLAQRSAADGVGSKMQYLTCYWCPSPCWFSIFFLNAKFWDQNQCKIMIRTHWVWICTSEIHRFGHLYCLSGYQKYHKVLKHPRLTHCHDNGSFVIYVLEYHMSI